MANTTVEKTKLKRGDIIGEDIISNGKIIADLNTVLNLYFILDIQNASDITEVPLLEKEYEEPKPPGDFKIHPVDDIIEKLYLADWDIDNELEILKNVKAITKKFNERTIEGLDFVISYYANPQARKIAAEGVLNIGYREYFPIAIMALLDEDKQVRTAVNRYFLKYKDDVEIVTELFKKYNYVNDNNRAEFNEVMTKMIQKPVIEKVQQAARNDNDTLVLEGTTEILNLLTK
jgi:hypothetical protein